MSLSKTYIKILVVLKNKIGRWSALTIVIQSEIYKYCSVQTYCYINSDDDANINDNIAIIVSLSSPPPPSFHTTTTTNNNDNYYCCIIVLTYSWYYAIITMNHFLLKNVYTIN